MNDFLDKLKATYTPINIIDLEATCDDPKPTWDGEIIEIGICKFNELTGVISHARSILVKPEQTPVTPFCTKLTTITQELLDRDGVTLEAAMEILAKEYFPQTGPKAVWASWGDYDRKMFFRDCAAKDLVFAGLGCKHLNLKPMISEYHKWNKPKGMGSALNFFNLPLVGTHHRGLDDALNIAKIYKKHLEIKLEDECKRFDAYMKDKPSKEELRERFMNRVERAGDPGTGMLVTRKLEPEK